MEYLQRLKNADKLESELLEWLRTNSCGKRLNISGFSRKSLIGLENPEYIETIAKHPFAIREMAKQNEDLQTLYQIRLIGHKKNLKSS